MTLKKCSNCNQLFDSTAQHDSDLCPDCFQQEKKRFRQVKEYLWANPGASVAEIANNVNVKEKIIRKFVREGRLERK